MKLNLETLSKLERRLHIEVPVEKVSEAFDRLYRAVQQQVELKGFRKGKAPLDKIRGKYKDRVSDDVAQELVQEYYFRGLKDQDLIPISNPQIEFDPVTENEPFKFSAQFDIRPTIELKKYEGLSVQKEKYEDSDEHVDESLERMRASRAKEEPLIVERPSKMGDLATIDFEGTVDGNVLEGGTAQGQTLEIGNTGFIEGFDDGLVEMNVGETKVLSLKFPEGYHAPELSGKPVEFKVTLTRLGTKKLPELNDDFAKEVGFGTYLELRDAIREDHRRGEQTRIKKDLKSRLLKALVENNPMEVPPTILKEQKQALIQDLHHRMEQQGMTHAQFEEYGKKWDADFEESAKFIVRSSFLVNEIAQKHDLKATGKDVEAKFEEYAQQTGIPLDKIKDYYKSEEQQSNLRFQITEEKVVDFLLSTANIEEVSADKLPKENN